MNFPFLHFSSKNYSRTPGEPCLHVYVNCITPKKEACALLELHRLRLRRLKCRCRSFATQKLISGDLRRVQYFTTMKRGAQSGQWTPKCTHSEHPWGDIYSKVTHYECGTIKFKPMHRKTINGKVQSMQNTVIPLHHHITSIDGTCGALYTM